MSDLKSQLKDAQKQAMRAKEKQRLVVIRSMLAEIKRVEVDERIELDDARILAILDKMLKQRRDSISQLCAPVLRRLRESLSALDPLRSQWHCRRRHNQSNRKTAYQVPR